MCEPVSTTSLVLGGLSAASAGAGAIASHQQASAQAAAQNRSIANRANQRNAQYELESLQGVAEYNTAKLGFKQETNQIGLEFSDFKAEEELARDDRINQYLMADQDLVIKLLGDQPVNEGGRARSRGKNLARTIGRQRGSLVANLNRSEIASKRAVDKARKSADVQRNKLFAEINNPYRSGPAPSQDVEFVKGPNPLGLVAGLAGAAVQGASTYNSFAPDGQKISDVFKPKEEKA